ncbi:MAG: hypothetical protein LUD18_03855 [Lachnospiraceae bacterium]|nr:hypothetical protein [Lachnospiraceae bacterium]
METVKIILLILAVGVAYALFCCVRVGAEADRWMESLRFPDEEEEAETNKASAESMGRTEIKERDLSSEREQKQAAGIMPAKEGEKVEEPIENR